MKKNIKSKLIMACTLSILGSSILPATVGFAAVKSKNIGLEKAKSIALKDAGLKSSNVNFIKAKLDTEDGVKVYDIEFYSGNKEYDYEIDALTGKIVEKDFDIENYTIKKQNQNKAKNNNQNKQNGLIGENKAKEIALKDAGLKASNVNFIKAKLDTDDGVKVYDIEFYSGNKEYDYEIDALTGKIVEKDFDIENYTIKKQKPNKGPKKPQNKQNGLIGEQKAREIALAASGVNASNAKFVKTKLDKEDGVQVYEIEFKLGKTEYSFEIDAKTGQIRESDVEYDD